ncbi:hypothetical protein [Saccharopolyspora spinosa]|uniref:hypothetical protein n=1 Tax=Saccharopolyspora spinosa TaxID=60894 RepID=UPI000237962D|nr:hypothetical protein [Saccharopolyspora spinosa]
MGWRDLLDRRGHRLLVDHVAAQSKHVRRYAGRVEVEGGDRGSAHGELGDHRQADARTTSGGDSGPTSEFAH